MRNDVSEANFDAFIEKHAVAAVLIHAPGEFSSEALEALARVCERMAMPSAMACVNRLSAPGLAAMFGVARTPYLLIFRERVALFAEPAHPTPMGLEGVLTQIQQLDMDKVRAELEAERQAREALLMRRACPTRHSGPARTQE